MPMLYRHTPVTLAEPVRAQARHTPGRLPRRLFRVAATALVIGLYVLGAVQHAERRNRVKAAGDQSAYVQYAKDLYANRQGQLPPIIGDRNRMPLYPALQSLFYDPSMSDDEFFAVGRRVSIALSVGLLALVWCCAATTLTPHASLNVALVAGFTCYVFKAGYFQADLTYYTLHFIAFATACRLLGLPPSGRAIALGAGLGVIAALSYLTKAAALPMVALVTIWMLVTPVARSPEAAPATGRGWAHTCRLCTAAALLGSFLLVLWPYASTSRRVFGQYFYNVNSTFYIWYDEWGDAIKGTRAHGDRVGWPTLPADRIPGPVKYWREHSLGQIGARLAGGFRQIVVDLWSGFWALKFVVLSVALTLLAIWPRRALVPDLVRRHWPLVGFVLLYFISHATLTAFYAPISGTGVARFSLTMYLPLLYVAAALRHHPRLVEPEAGWRASAHLEWFITATLALDVPFSIWPRLMTTYGGY
jgi:hypothetical protein